ncbi:alkaline-phosphatase-like protein [Corynascus novoguineensis]|uniref:Alkaline-phosphatase-like protein n=1 Tax=Corynascus novoguineensis TaxID=1126955 RepID=A0AAN7CYT9_9PEZI|nr:alkaline-phosphatase-like protein [Corynascus novoguineensis]
MPLQPLKTTAVGGRDPSLLSPSEYDADAISIRSDQDTDSDDDERQLRARNSRELRAHDRLVLMEEEELDHLVIETRRKQERQRRGSGLPIPNPIKLLTRRLSDASRSRSRSPSVQPGDSAEDLGTEKRRARRQRREMKRDRLLVDAQHGEDGELMYEMEEGGMKDGSSTGESSDRDDSDEVDRKHLLHVAETKMKRKRNCRRWVLLYAIIVVAFAILVLVAWKLSLDRKTAPYTQKLVSNGTAMFAPTTIIISLDGFRADFLNRGLTPRLNALVKEGVSPLYMLPSFPSVTFPNHYTIATGLYPESHGVVGNSFWDPVLREEFYYTDPSRSMEPKWWQGEPFWVTAQKQGLKTAIHMWPGSEAHILDFEPTYVDKYNGKELLPRKVDRILGFLDMPDADRPQIIAAYVPNVDADGHKYGPNSTEIRFTIQKVDKMLDSLFKGLEERHLTEIVNIIVVSDHGMATTDVSRLVQLEDLVDLDKIEHTDGWPLIGLRPKDPAELQDIHRGLIEKTKGNPNLEVYLRDVDMPARYHFSDNKRIAPLWIVPKAGWALVKIDEMNLKEAQAEGAVYHPRGLHGYDHEHPLMRAIFIARGPAFPHQPNSKLEVFQNIEVYNMLCDSVGITPVPNNGTLRLPLKPIGLHEEPATNELDTPADPAEVHTTSTSAAPPPPPKPTSSVSVNTGSTGSAAEPSVPSKSVGVDQPVSPPQSTNEPTSEPASDSSDGGKSGSDSDTGGDEDDPSAVDKVESKVKDFWDWFTGKVGTWWDKVTGNAKGGEDGGQDKPSE